MLRLIEGVSYDRTPQLTYADVGGFKTEEEDLEDVGDFWSSVGSALGQGINVGAQLYSQRMTQRHERQMASMGWEFQPTPFPPQMFTQPFIPNQGHSGGTNVGGGGIDKNVLLLGALGIGAIMVLKK